MNKKQVLQLLHNKKVIKEAINCFTIDQNEDLKKAIINSLEDNNCTIADFEEDDLGYSIKGFNQIWRKSKLKKVEEGTLTIRSNDYIFTNNKNQNSYGTIPKKSDMIILDNGFITVIKWLQGGEYQGFKYTLKGVDHNE